MEMPHTCSIMRQSLGGTDTYGAETVTRSTVASNVSCFIQGMSIGERERWQAREMQVDVKIYFPEFPSQLRENDIIVINDNDCGTSYEGQRFIFLAIDDATAGMGEYFKAICRREVNPRVPSEN